MPDSKTRTSPNIAAITSCSARAVPPQAATFASRSTTTTSHPTATATLRTATATALPTAAAIAARPAAFVLVGTFDLAALCVMAVLCTLALPTPAFAYVDPSVMTYTIQALAGVAVALGAVAGVAFRRTRKAIFKLFKIDENANKVVEDAVSRCESDGMGLLPTHPSHEKMQAGYSPNRNGAGAHQTPTPLARRIVLSVIASLLLVFTLCVATPLEIYISGQSDLTINVADLLPIITVAAVALSAVLTVVLSCLRGSAFRIALAIVTALGICLYMQAMFLNTGLPLANGDKFNLAQHIPMAVVSAVVWIALFAIVLIAAAKATRPTQNALACVSIALVLVQSAGIGSLFIGMQQDGTTAKGAAASSTGEWFVTEDGMFEVGSKNNVIVFVLDTFDETYLDDVLSDYPDALDGYTGFTRYHNCAAKMIPTRYGVPYLLTREEPDPTEDFDTYLQERYSRSSFIERIAQAGYSVGLYSDTLAFDKIADSSTVDKLVGSTINLHGVDKSNVVDACGTLQVLYQCALYRDMPWVFKAPFWFTTDQINQSIVRTDDTLDQADTIYTMDDAAWCDTMEANDLSIDDRGYAGTFRFIHLQGAHYPYNLDENCNDLGFYNSTMTRQNRGVLYAVEQYLNEMKRLGVYEDATIIITADHGNWFFSPQSLEYPTSSIMLVKPSGASEGTPTMSSAPVSHSDFHATVLAAMGANTQGFGESIWEAESSTTESNAATRTRTYYDTLTDYWKDIGIVQWQINGDVLDFSSWNRTGIEWNFPEGLKTFNSSNAAQ